MFCHGYEERGAGSAGLIASGLLGNTMFAPPVSRMASRLASTVNVYTDGNAALGAEIRAVLKSTKKFRIENRKIKGLAKDTDIQGEAGVLVTLEDGTVNREGFIVSQPYLLPLSVDSPILGVIVLINVRDTNTGRRRIEGQNRRKESMLMREDN